MPSITPIPRTHEKKSPEKAGFLSFLKRDLLFYPLYVPKRTQEKNVNVNAAL